MRFICNTPSHRVTTLFPGSGYTTRMSIYLMEMFPPASRILLACLCVLAACGFVYAETSAAVERPGLLFLAGWNLLSLLLMLRMMDELKDLAHDRDIFPWRPVPSGRVTETDVRFSLAALTISYLGLNIWMSTAVWSAVGVLAYAILMFKYFFIPGILRRRPFLNLATHTPIIPLALTQILVLTCFAYGLTINTLPWPRAAAFIVMVWAACLGWEIARKIRGPREEDAYLTYSRLLGRPGAVAFAMFVQTMALVLGIYVYISLQQPALSFIMLGGVYTATLVAHFAFLSRPVASRTKESQFAELFLGGLLAAQALPLVLTK